MTKSKTADQNPPESQQDDHSQNEKANTGNTVSNDGSHLDHFVIPSIDDVIQDEDAPIDLRMEPDPFAEPEETDNIMDKDAFWQVFKSVFSIPAFIIPDLRQLAIASEEEREARAASDATYSLLEIYYPQALMPQGEIFGHLMVAGPFFIGKAMIVREVLRSRKAKPVYPRNEQPQPEEAEQPSEGGADHEPIVVDVDMSDWETKH